MKSKKPHISISQLNMMSRCGEQYRRRYVLGEKNPPGIALIVGSAVDKAVTLNLENKMAGRGLLAVDEVADAAADSFEERWNREEIALNDEELKLGIKQAKGQGHDRSVRLAKLHSQEMAPHIEPTHLQREIKVVLEGHPYDLLGYIDIQEGTNAIRDTKTSGKTPPKDVADRDDQLTLYAMMACVNDGIIPKLLSLDYLIDLKTAPVSKSFLTTRMKEDFKPIIRRIEAASLALEKGVFIPARESDWWCNERWCGFHSNCKFVKRSRRPANAD